MTDKTVKVGDVVAWDEVPDLTIALDEVGDCVVRTSGDLHQLEFDLLRPVSAKWVHYFRGQDVWKSACRHSSNAKRPLTIVALNLSGNENSDDLRALAEAFEREHPAT